MFLSSQGCRPNKVMSGDWFPNKFSHLVQITLVAFLKSGTWPWLLRFLLSLFIIVALQLGKSFEIFLMKAMMPVEVALEAGNLILGRKCMVCLR
jgi:hypothetical protein